MSVIRMRLLRLAVWARRHPWLFALLGFLAGLCSFVLVDRQEGMAAIIAALMLLGWFWLLLERPISYLLERSLGIDLPPLLVRFSAQVVHQESFFFVLPFFFITTTWDSAQAGFAVLIALAALVSVIDPLYYGWLSKRRWLFLAYHSLALFVLLLTALPIIFSLATGQSYLIATVLGMLLALPSLRQAVTSPGIAGLAGLAMLTLALGAVAWFGRLVVPPATLWLVESVVTTQIDEKTRSPGIRREQLSPSELSDGGLYVYTAIRAPRGLSEHVYHQWLQDGREVDRVALEIEGGREAGYRAWSHKLNFPADPRGRWQVRVKTETGQMLGVVRFRVAGAAHDRDSRLTDSSALFFLSLPDVFRDDDRVLTMPPWQQ